MHSSCEPAEARLLGVGTVPMRPNGPFRKMRPGLRCMANPEPSATADHPTERSSEPCFPPPHFSRITHMFHAHIPTLPAPRKYSLDDVQRFIATVVFHDQRRDMRKMYRPGSRPAPSGTPSVTSCPAFSLGSRVALSLTSSMPRSSPSTRLTEMAVFPSHG